LSECGYAYAGKMLVHCGEVEQKLAEARRDFIAAATKDFLQPLHTFLDGDMKTVQVWTLNMLGLIYINLQVIFVER